jgi:hypothetical protein
MIKNYIGLFQMWDYRVSHGRLIFRKNKGEGNGGRIEICFFNVKDMLLSTLYNDLELSLVSPNELPESYIFEASESLNVYRLVGSKSVVGFVVAGSVEIREDDLEYFDKSSFDV